MTDLVLDRWARARANVNIALIKYWGKSLRSDPSGRPPRYDEVNIPAVPSLSLTLDGLYTETWARFDPELDRDRIELDGVTLEGEEQARAVALLDALRDRMDLASPFRIVSNNAVPTAAGLASSASGMAALAAAAGRCAGLTPERDAPQLSELARVGSGSAARSVYGGWVTWLGRRAEPLADAAQLPVAVVIAVIGTGRKPIGSRAAMLHTQRTSPYYPAWVQQSHATFAAAKRAVVEGDLPALLRAMERSTWRMHAAAMAADPPVCYWRPASLAVLSQTAEWRAAGMECGATLDAGPNVKVFCRPKDAEAIARRVSEIPGVQSTITSSPGSGILVSIESREPDTSGVGR